MAIRKMEHVGIMVKNLDTSIAFYKDVLGMVLFDKFQTGDGSATLAFLGFRAQEDVVIELIERKNGEFPNEGKVHHLAFTVENLEGEIKRLRELDIVFKTDGISSLPNGSRYIFLEGPDQESLELFEPTK